MQLHPLLHLQYHSDVLAVKAEQRTQVRRRAGRHGKTPDATAVGTRAHGEVRAARRKFCGGYDKRRQGAWSSRDRILVRTRIQ